MKKPDEIHWKKNAAAGHLCLLLLALVVGGVLAAYHWNLMPESSYIAEQFHITTVQSTVDFNHNGTDDYTDLLLGARADAERHPTYNGKYWETGYPPDEIGVCTDVVWRAFRQAGYNLRAMVDQDILARPKAYPNIVEPDSNIDFRRVQNLHTFFETYAVSLTLDTNDIAEWQPGDIVIFGNDWHIGIVSDKRSKTGQSYIIHNQGQPKREEDYFSCMKKEVSAHYRFDASQVADSVLIPWQT